MKICTSCKKNKEFDKFHKDSDNWDGFTNRCKECVQEHNRLYYEQNKEKINLKTRERRKNNIEKYKKFEKQYYESNKEERKRYAQKQRILHPEKKMLQQARSRAKKNGLTFNLVESDIVIPETCPVLGIKLEKGNKKVQDNSPSLDRIDNTKGYVRGNIIVVSFKANTIKNNATIDEILKVAHFYKDLI